MKASEGKLGRIFIVTLEPDDRLPGALEDFAHERGINIAQVMIMGEASLSGIIAPGEHGRPALNMTGAADPSHLAGGEVVIQEILGINVRRVEDVATGRERLAMLPASVTRVMEKPAPAPEESGPGTVPVYLFNAEFN